MQPELTTAQDAPTYLWFVFGGAVLASLILDLGIFHRKRKEESLKTSLRWSAFWIGLALAFNVLLFITRGRDAAIEFLTAYLAEESLSIDNLFVFSALFGYFAIPARHQHRILFWGILGAIVMRAVFIFGLLELVHYFTWVLYVLAALLIFTGVRIVFSKKEGEVEPERTFIVRFLRKIFPVSTDVQSGNFLSRVNGRTMITPLLICLMVVEVMDVMFAIDSVPMVISVVKSRDPLIIYSSNIFAILGLRALYFVLASMIDRFRYLKVGIGLLLILAGAKLVADEGFNLHLPNLAALGIIAGVIAGSVALSSLRPTRDVPAGSAGKK